MGRPTRAGCRQECQRERQARPATSGSSVATVVAAAAMLGTGSAFGTRVSSPERAPGVQEERVTEVMFGDHWDRGLSSATALTSHWIPPV
ncbi:hypothetical protein [Ferrimicrobium acidiphilum]|uniref:hypothetical protein n=1 Tax=Ferrimicrobium acidiphilum TaxID=121039 RepID=UPI0023F55036|nr:hypothetical protein [Ferrimicrobium acidiphilum]